MHFSRFKYIVKKYFILIITAVMLICIINFIYSLIVFIQVYLHIQKMDVPDSGGCNEPYCFEVVQNDTFPGTDTYIIRDHLMNKIYYVCDVVTLIPSFIPQDAAILKDSDGSIKCYFWLRRFKILENSLKGNCIGANRFYREHEPFNIYNSIINSIKNT